jgi:hypothetical protein
MAQRDPEYRLGSLQRQLQRARYAPAVGRNEVTLPAPAIELLEASVDDHPAIELLGARLLPHSWRVVGGDFGPLLEPWPDSAPLELGELGNAVAAVDS